MSYNIDSIRILKNDHARMRVRDVRKALKSMNGDGDSEDECYFPEGCFLGEIDVEGKKPAEWVEVVVDGSFWWYGEGSGSSWDDVFITKIAPKIMGTLEAVIVWEGGESVSGLRIVDGVVTEPEVEMRLAEVAP